MNMRKVELKQRLARLEANLREALDEEEFSKFQEGYFMNRTRGKPDFSEDQSIQEAAAEFAAKDAEKKAKRDKKE